mmetsp:Transcript_6332/g.14052  ORF Transcript_6332/g.14052 Transcript_6332/m.14052 type:complete len:205 (+) Transcript_6332:206-820(+)
MGEDGEADALTVVAHPVIVVGDEEIVGIAGVTLAVDLVVTVGGEIVIGTGGDAAIGAKRGGGTIVRLVTTVVRAGALVAPVRLEVLPAVEMTTEGTFLPSPSLVAASVGAAVQSTMLLIVLLPLRRKGMVRTLVGGEVVAAEAEIVEVADARGAREVAVARRRDVEVAGLVLAEETCCILVSLLGFGNCVGTMSALLLGLLSGT